MNMKTRRIAAAARQRPITRSSRAVMSRCAMASPEFRRISYITDGRVKNHTVEGICARASQRQSFGVLGKRLSAPSVPRREASEDTKARKEFHHQRFPGHEQSVRRRVDPARIISFPLGPGRPETTADHTSSSLRRRNGH
jgi:hypothetical protein